MPLYLNTSNPSLTIGHTLGVEAFYTKVILYANTPMPQYNIPNMSLLWRPALMRAKEWNDLVTLTM